MKFKQLKVVRFRPNHEDEIESKIIQLLTQEIYRPLIKELGLSPRSLQNSYEDLIKAVLTGQIQYVDGHFEGRFDANISREIRKIGGRWDRTQGWWKVPRSFIDPDLVTAIEAGRSRFEQMAKNVLKRIDKVLPDEVASKLSLEKTFDSTIYRFNKDFESSIKGITTAPTLTDAQREKLASEYTQNMQRYIKGWTEEEIVKLREKVKRQIFDGVRQEELRDIIRSSFRIGENKAKFLAGQESRLLLTKLRESRYVSAGVNQYKWQTVNMPKQSAGQPYQQGQVRHDHAILDGKIFTWDSPPITNRSTGARNNAGEDFGCRCIAIPLLKF